MTKELEFFDFKGRPLPLNTHFTNIYYMQVKTAAARDKAIAHARKSQYLTPWDESSYYPATGFFYYNEDEDRWHCYDTEIAKLDSIAKIFKK